MNIGGTDFKLPKTLIEAIVYFSDEQKALNFFVSVRWPDGVTCPYCECRRLSFISTRRVWHCSECKKRFSAKVGTIMEDATINVGVWMIALWMLTGAKNGISSCELSRSLGICQKTAWFLLRRLRTVRHYFLKEA